MSDLDAKNLFYTIAPKRHTFPPRRRYVFFHAQKCDRVDAILIIQVNRNLLVEY